jgi:hypothetical protein
MNVNIETYRATNNIIKQISGIFLIFSLICFATAIFFSCSTDKVISDKLPKNGGIFGPVTISKKNAVYDIRIEQITDYGHYASIEGSVLDKNKQYLFGFGKELWSETGYDSEGSWSERINDFNFKITFKEPGDYYFQVESELSNPKHCEDIWIEVTPTRASSLAHIVLGIMSLLAGIIAWFFGNLADDI